MTRTFLAGLVAGGLLAACGGGTPDDPDYVEGRTVYRTCAACHGANGRGGVGPSLEEVLQTFPGCDDHVRWIALGSEGWQDEVGSAYGSGDTPVAGGMPGFGGSLSDEAIRKVALYERVRFGGGELEVEKVACGLG